MNDVPPFVVYVTTGAAALFLCVLCHLFIRSFQGRLQNRPMVRGKKGEPLANEVDTIIEQLTLLAATPGRTGNDPESNAVLRRITELSLQHLELAGPLTGFVSGVRRAQTAEEANKQFLEMLNWMKANRTALSSPPHAS